MLLMDALWKREWRPINWLWPLTQAAHIQFRPCLEVVDVHGVGKWLEIISVYSLFALIENTIN
jgi:hypothetical protein